MLVGLLVVDLYLPYCNSLKEKRYIMKSLKERVKSKFNVSIAETDSQDLWQRSTLAVAVVARDGAQANSVLSRVVNFIEREKKLHILDYNLKFL